MHATRQADFNTAYTRILAQGKPAMTGESCLYTTPDGLHCGIGMLMTNDELAIMGGRCGDVASLDIPRFNDDIEFYTDLQNSHDDAGVYAEDFIVGFKERMEAVAIDYDLEIP